MSQIVLRNALFWEYQGRVESSWYLCGDGATADMRAAHINWCLKHKLNAVLLCLNNEDLISMFKPGKWGQGDGWDMARANLVVDYLRQIKAAGLMTAVAHYDGPAIPGAKYHPILDCDDSKHVYYLQTACKTLYELIDIHLVGCETNRYWSTAKVNQGIEIIKQFAPMRFVGSHEQNTAKRNGKWILTRPVPSAATCWCLETTNHPKDGDLRTPADMAAEVAYLCSQTNVPVWVAEHNLYSWKAKGRAQADAMAKVDGVYGMNY